MAAGLYLHHLEPRGGRYRSFRRKLPGAPQKSTARSLNFTSTLGVVVVAISSPLVGCQQSTNAEHSNRVFNLYRHPILHTSRACRCSYWLDQELYLHPYSHVALAQTDLEAGKSKSYQCTIGRTDECRSTRASSRSMRPKAP